LLVFREIAETLPSNTALHCANSASIRYAQLFKHRKDIRHYANRGTSGIDGSTSTAIGHAICTEDPVVLVTGDVAFMYDNAGFWNDRLPPNLKIIIVNNGGGNIFRIIKGPDRINGFERFQETEHNLDLRAIAQLHAIPHHQIEGDSDLEKCLDDLFKKPGLAILEVLTPRFESPEVLESYFKALKN
jgi:2-succinyl-5-enolpyruvyl-6-hydroxy-3-cyclohexene-1-carboxylate synthase